MHKTTLFTLLAAIILMACEPSTQKNNQLPIPATEPQIIADTIYTGGEIITMAGDELNYAQAVAISGDKIIFVGDTYQAMTYGGETTELVDLANKTMMPGFVEPHVHPSLAAIMLTNEIIAPYDWVLPDTVKKGVQDHPQYIKRITESIQQNAQDNEMYFIWGYHQLWHGELSRQMLNDIAGNKPVGVIHRSFHEIFLNDAAIAKLGISENDFAGNPQVEWQKGHFFEGGWLALVPKMAPILLEPKRYLQGLGIMSQLILKNGITTVAEPGFPSSDFDGEYQLLKTEMDKNPPYEVYLIPSGTQLYAMKGGNQQALAFTKTLASKYNTDNIKFLPNQIKLFADGAIYSQLMQMQGDYTDGHQGQWMTPLDLLQQQLSLYWNEGYKIHVHANGDLGIQQILDFNVLDQQANPRNDHGFTLHHMGYFSDQQARQIAGMGIEASVNPYYLWALADKYAEFGLGKERAENLVRLKSLVDKNIPLSFHSDFSMAPMEPLTLAWTAIIRITSQGSKFSQDQRIQRYDAMKAITIDAAKALDLDGEIGSIAPGKTANFTILANNPFTIDPMKIKDIKVHATVYRGKQTRVPK